MSLIELLLLGALVQGAPQPTPVNSEKFPGNWRKVGDGVWKKHVIANQATVRMALLGDRTYFAITIPCGKKDDRSETTYRWKAGDAIAKSKEPCSDGEPTIKAERVMDLFLPLPADYDPLRKEKTNEPGLII